MRRRANRAAAAGGLALALLALSGCSAVRMSRLRPDYEQVDKNKVKRLSVVVQPLPDDKPKVGELWGLLTKRYVNQKRDFIVKQSVAEAGPALDLKAQCGAGLEGVLWIKPALTRREGGMEVSAAGQLLRCGDGQEVWAAEAGGSWPTVDNLLKEVTAVYVEELGQEVEPYVAPSFNLLRPLLDTLPNPVLTEEDKDEKIELGE